MGNRKYVRRHAGDIINGAELIGRRNTRIWEMRCKCGETFFSQPSYTSGKCRKCASKEAGMKKFIHGESPSIGKTASRLYNIWDSMRTRCNNPRNSAYMHYGGRGISVCPEWGEYLNFKKWALENGYSDSLKLDRIDNDGNYEPGNCRWATQKEQCRNKRDNWKITFNGETHILQEWAEITGLRRETIANRIKTYGYSIEEALTLSPNEKRGNKKR